MEKMKKFVTFEGIDGSGKTTVINRIYEELKKKNCSVVLTKEPTDSWIGRCVQQCIKSKTDPVVTAFAFISDRIVHGKEIERWLEKYNLVLCDRYAESTYAYQGAQLLDSIENPMKWLQELSKNRFPIPNITFIFDINPEIAIKRIQDRDDLIDFEKVSFLENVRKNYLTLAKQKHCVIIDASNPIHELVEQCSEIIMA
jgi:dTMP kinase